MRKFIPTFILAGAALILLAAGARADVTRKHKTVSQGWGSYESTSTEYYTADKSASDAVTRWTKGLMKTMTGGKEVQSIDITRVDQQLFWKLDPKKETYTEMTFAQLREQIEKGQEEMEEAEEEIPDTTSEDLYEWTVETQSAAEPKVINGFTCRNVRMMATGVNKQNAEDKVWITFDLWNSEEVPGAEEIRAFSESYLQALGLNVDALTPGLTSAAALYRNQFNTLAEEMKKAPGEAVLSTIEIKRRQLVGPSVGKAVSNAAQEEVLGKLPFGKKKAKKAEEPKWEERIKFLATTELLEASQGAVESTRFEVPEGYKLKPEK
ncbi:MAG: hypothetical protein C4524_03785 [Candidatus Zixiibacteriota bacterium]|nr:MAG: hypothetical protein C4524_03785 [candidate division Zixibacteria bacterium]